MRADRVWNFRTAVQVFFPSLGHCHFVDWLAQLDIWAFEHPFHVLVHYFFKHRVFPCLGLLALGLVLSRLGSRQVQQQIEIYFTRVVPRPLQVIYSRLPDVAKQPGCAGVELRELEHRVQVDVQIAVQPRRALLVNGLLRHSSRLDLAALVSRQVELGVCEAMLTTSSREEFKGLSVPDSLRSARWPRPPLPLAKCVSLFCRSSG